VCIYIYIYIYSIYISLSLARSLALSLSLFSSFPPPLDDDLLDLADQNTREVILVFTRNGELWMYTGKNSYIVAQDEAHDYGRINFVYYMDAEENPFLRSGLRGEALNFFGIRNCKKIGSNLEAHHKDWRAKNPDATPCRDSGARFGDLDVYPIALCIKSDY
jgi:hypothetical protein